MDTRQIGSLYILFGLDKNKSIWQQYGDYWIQLFHGDLGLSFTFFPTPVSEVIKQSLPWTLALIGTTTVLSFVLGTAIGTMAGCRRGSWAASTLPVSTFLAAIPFFWLGLIMIPVFAGPDSYFPSSGGFDPGVVPGWTSEFISTAVRHSLLPAITILIASISGWI